MRHVEAIVHASRAVPLPTFAPARREPHPAGARPGVVLGRRRGRRGARRHALLDLAHGSRDHGLDATFAVAAELEGHPDNAAAAVFGGFTIAVAGRRPCVSLDPHPSLRPVVLIPDGDAPVHGGGPRALASTRSPRAGRRLQRSRTRPSWSWPSRATRTSWGRPSATDSIRTRGSRWCREVRDVFDALRADGVPVVRLGRRPVAAGVRARRARACPTRAPDGRRCARPCARAAWRSAEA